MSCVKYTLACYCKFFYSEFCWETIISHVSLHLFSKIYDAFLKMILIKGNLMGISFDVGRVTVYAHYTKKV